MEVGAVFSTCARDVEGEEVAAREEGIRTVRLSYGEPLLGDGAVPIILPDVSTGTVTGGGDVEGFVGFGVDDFVKTVF